MQHNYVSIAGNLTRDPELRYGPSGVAIASFSVAVNRKWRSKEGEEKSEVAFIDCKAFGAPAESLGTSFRKGNNIALNGRLVTESWEDKETHAKRSKLVVQVEGFPGLVSRTERAEPAPEKEPAPTSEKPAAAAAPDDNDDVPF